VVRLGPPRPRVARAPSESAAKPGMEPPFCHLDLEGIAWSSRVDHRQATHIAAMPPLVKVQHVVILSINEGKDKAAGVGLVEFARHLHCDPCIVRRGRTSPAELAATARDCGAGMLVMGASGHRPAKERLFGGCTRAMIEAAELPMFLFH
jgi:nucleotide-binding universal stress UspA family protein